ncbi:hypothetical protein SAMN04487934_101643 [Eubacterium ruminantium]|nr:hypothetical protein SAMN04487934_101643 [Eubacterium ruminantium]
MKCIYCGEENSDDAFFCRACNKRIGQTKENTEILTGTSKNKVILESYPRPKKKLYIAVFIGLMAVALCVAVVLFIKGGKKTDDKSEAPAGKTIDVTQNDDNPGSKSERASDIKQSEQSVSDASELLSTEATTEIEDEGVLSDLYQLKGCDVYYIAGKLGFPKDGIIISGDKATFDYNGIYGNGIKNENGQYIVNKIAIKEESTYTCCGVKWGMNTDETVEALKKYCTENIEYMNDLYNSEYWIDTFTPSGDVIGIAFKDEESTVEKVLVVFRSEGFAEKDLTPEDCLVAVKNYYYGGQRESWKDVNSKDGEYWTVEHIDQEKCTVVHSVYKDTIYRYHVNMKTGDTNVTMELLGSQYGEIASETDKDFNVREYLK